ncbi:MAG: hypothetical protein ACOCV1_08390 [Bacillota bacterium]
MKKDIQKNQYEESMREMELSHKILDLLEKGTLSSLKEVLKIVIDKTKEDQYDNMFKEVFNIYISDNDYLNLMPFTYRQESSLLTLFVVRVILLTLYSEPNVNKLKIENYNWLLEYVKSYKKTNAKPLKHKTFQKLMNILKENEIMKLLAYNQYNSPLTFFEINFENNLNNSMYHPSSNIILLNAVSIEKQERVGALEYIFFHELGHVLQVNITGTAFIVPESFKTEIVNKLFPEAGDEILPEIFADCFSVFLMSGTEFEDKNSLIDDFGEYNVMLLKRYFDFLIRELNLEF